MYIRFFTLKVGFRSVMSKVLNSDRGRGRGRVKVFTISAVTAVAL
ncbi:hypothetical protein A2U01_0088027, partial [Trifolium medium]|nr:hypothetical protein [Trifolium medium]